LADRERQLIVGNDDLHASLVLVHDDLRDLRGGEGAANELSGIGRPGDDVDLLAAKLLYDGLYARALHAHAGANGIDVRIVGGHAGLGAPARLARHRLDLDDSLVDLGHLLFEGLLQKARMRARKHDLRALARHVDVENVGADAILRAVALARNLLLFRQDGVDVGSELDDEIFALEASDDAGDDLFLAILD